jgi:hypothetical protein
MRYFFDVVTTATVQLDFQGRTFATPEPAHDLAEMIALDIECSDAEATEVVVRDIKGGRLFSVNVRPSDLVAEAPGGQQR